MIRQIVTHPGGAHKDDFLACSVLVHLYQVPIHRREPTEDLVPVRVQSMNPSIVVARVDLEPAERGRVGRRGEADQRKQQSGRPRHASAGARIRAFCHGIARARNASGTRA